MQKIATIGLDLAKDWFHVHGVTDEGQVVARRRLRRGEVISFFRSLEPCLVGMEACATSHYWARGLAALGHCVKLMPPGLGKKKQGVLTGISDHQVAVCLCISKG
jgi:transposase